MSTIVCDTDRSFVHFDKTSTTNPLFQRLLMCISHVNIKGKRTSKTSITTHVLKQIPVCCDAIFINGHEKCMTSFSDHISWNFFVQ